MELRILLFFLLYTERLKACTMVPASFNLLAKLRKG